MTTYFYLLPREIDEAIWGAEIAATHRYNNSNTQTVVNKNTTDKRAAKLGKSDLLVGLYVMDDAERRVLASTPEWTAPSDEDVEETED